MYIYLDGKSSLSLYLPFTSEMEGANCLIQRVHSYIEFKAGVKSDVIYG